MIYHSDLMRRPCMVTLAMIRLMLHRLVQPNRKRLPAP